LSIVYTLIILCVLILVHEFGHFIVAKLCDVHVKEFSLGMGPQIAKWGKKETQYSLRVFPIGGFVSMVGEDEDSDDPRAFCKKPVWQRLLITFCGPFMNFILAIVLFVVSFMYFGVAAEEPLIGSVAVGTPAYSAGILAGDTITDINGEEIENWTELSAAIRAAGTAEMQVGAVREDGTAYTVSLTPIYDESQGFTIIGITQGMVRADLFGSIKQGFVNAYEFTRTLLVSLWQMITGQMALDVAGPVGMVSIVGAYADTALMSLFLLGGILSINLGVINLLPFPGLDGSRIVFLAIEGVRGKPVPSDKEAMVHFLGLVCLMAFMIFITINDVGRLIGG